jgi:cysteine-rich repeat protein
MAMAKTVRRRGVVVLAVALAIVSGREAAADALKCKATIAKQSALYVQKRAKALLKCEDAKTKGKLPAAQVCASEPKTQKVLTALAAKLGLTVAGACGGADKTCGTADDEPLASIGWGAVATCPDFGSSGCTQPIGSCSDVASCIECSADAAVGQAMALYYGSLDPAAFATGNAVNKCQQAIGKETTKFLAAKSKALQKCWNARLVAGTASACPDAAATLAIALADQKKIAGICKACGGADKLCDGAGDVPPSAVGFVASCPAVTPPGGASCARPIATAEDVVACVDCVTGAAISCIDALAVPEFVSPLPPQCNTTTTTTTSTTTTAPTTTTSTTLTFCGNGVRDLGEQCDDGNATNLDGCDAGCRFEQNQRVTSLAFNSGTDAVCTQNALGKALFPGGGSSTDAGTQVNGAVASAVADGSISLLFRLLGLDDLSGTTDAAVSVGVLGGTPVAGTGYDGTNDVDWWYTADPATIDVDRNPLTIFDGSVSGHVLLAGPGRVAFTFDFSGTPLALSLSSVVLRSMNGAISTPLASAGTPPGHLAVEQIDPTLQSYQTSTGGRLCGNVSALSMAQVPIPSALTGGGLTACSQNYSTANSLLDMIVNGCTIFFVQVVKPTQPDTVDPAQPLLGAGGPYTLSSNAQKAVSTCRDKNGVVVDLAQCLATATYSSSLSFVSDRVVIK